MEDQSPQRPKPFTPVLPLLPLWATVNKAYGLTWRHRRVYLKILVVWAPLLFSVMWISAWLMWPALKTFECDSVRQSIRFSHTDAHAYTHDRTLYNSWLTVIGFFELIAEASLAVAWHRLILNNETPAKGVYLRADRLVLRYLGFIFVIALLFCEPMLASFFMPQHDGDATAAAFWAMIAGMVFTWLVAARLCVMPPAIATEKRDVTVADVWRMTRSNTWRLFWGIIFCVFPGIILPSYLMSGSCEVDRIAGSALFALGQLSIALLCWPLYLAFFSLSYRHFFEYGQPENPAIQGTPRFPLKTVMFALLALGAFKAYLSFTG